MVKSEKPEKKSERLNCRITPSDKKRIHERFGNDRNFRDWLLAKFYEESNDDHYIKTLKEEIAISERDREVLLKKLRRVNMHIQDLKIFLSAHETKRAHKPLREKPMKLVLLK